MEKETTIPRPKVIFIDVYQTLLDMADMERRVNGLLDSKRGFNLWFELFMQYCFVENCTSQFNNFISIARATLEMSMTIFSRRVDHEKIEDTLELLHHLPVNENAPEGLSRLNDAGFRIVALTNAPQDIVMNRMERTGLVSYFEKVLSAEHVKKYKPCTEVYRWAMKELDVTATESLLVSSHGWDIAGACNAGMQTAYLQQERQVPYPLTPHPNFVCKNLTELTTQLQVQDGGTNLA